MGVVFCGNKAARWTNRYLYTMRQRLTFLLLLTCTLSFLLSSCWEGQTDDPIKAYRLWAGEPPPANLKVLHGNYWQSAHWSKEYVLYLEVIAPKDWWLQFIHDNKLHPSPLHRPVPEELGSMMST